MSSKRKKLMIVCSLIFLIGVGIFIGWFYWFASQLFPHAEPYKVHKVGNRVLMGGTDKEQASAFAEGYQAWQEKNKVFNDPFHLSTSYFEKGKYDLALQEAKKALEGAERLGKYIGMAHEQLLDIYLAMGDVINAEKELEWLDRDVRQSGTWDKAAFPGQTMGDIQMEYRKRLEELKKSQQKGNRGE